MITKAIEKAYKHRRDKQWEYMYWAFDVHETIVRPNWSITSIPTEFYPGAREALRLITALPYVKRIMYTCSHPDEIQKYRVFFQNNGILFDYVNENPEVTNRSYGYYNQKPYFNVLFEDKAGFDATEDWFQVIRIINELNHE